MKEDNKKPPREFRLIVDDWHTNALSWDKENDLTTGEEIHVIEYSACNDLKISHDTCQKQLSDSVIDKFKLVKENQSLQTRVARLRWALQRIAEDFGTDYCDGNCMIAHEALEKDKNGDKVD